MDLVHLFTGPEGRIMHAEMKIGDSIVMCADEMEMPGNSSNSGFTRKTPKNAGATTGGVMLYLKDVDAVFERAVAAGATAVMPPSDQFWGDRYGQIEDPYGHVWALATHVRVRDAVKLVVDQRHQRIERRALALAPAQQKVGDVVRHR